MIEHSELEVPERRSDPAARALQLPVLRLPAASPRAGVPPLFRLGGGPGMSNLRFRPAPAIGASREVVLVGYRGVDGSTRLDCPEVTTALRRTQGDVLGVASRRRVASAAAAAAARFAGDGIDVAGYTVAEVLADLDAARAALGYDRIDLLSESYGTRVALLYAQEHPAHVRRSVLLGVNPPGRFVWDPSIVDAQLDDWGRLWVESGIGLDRDRDLATTLRQALERLPHRWCGLRIDPGKAKIVTFVLLFQRRTGLIAVDAWQAAARGDPSGVALLSLAYDIAVPKAFTWGDFMAKAFSVDLEPGRDYVSWLDPPDAALGSPLSLLFYGGGIGWPPTPAPDSLRQLRPSAVESLLVSGALDVSTPPQIAHDEALPFLEHGTQVVVPNASHVDDLWGLQPEAIGHLVTTFLDTGVVEARFDAIVPSLKPAMRFPAVARATVATVGAALVAVMARVHHRRVEKGSKDPSPR